MHTFKGRVLKYGSHINTDIISPPAYMELPIDEMARYAMSTIDKEFSAKCKPGDIFVAEENLGSGSSRETAPLTLKHLGIRVIVACSFARIFYRNCINLGIVALQCKDATKIADQDMIEIDVTKGKIFDVNKSEVYNCDALPTQIMHIINAGGLIEKLKRELNEKS